MSSIVKRQFPVGVVARNVFLEVIRDRVLYLIALYALALIGTATLIPQLAIGAQDKIMLDLGLAGIHLLGLLVTVFVGTGLINKEIERRTVLVMLAKPLSRGAFVVGKHLGLMMVLTILSALLMAIYLGVLASQQIPIPWASLFLAVGFNLLELTLLTAVAMLFGVVTSSLLATLLTLGVYLMGHLSASILAAGELSENPAIEQFTRGLYLILPDLARFNLRNAAVYGLDLLPPPPELLGHCLYGGLYTAFLLTLTSFIFARRQF